MVLDQETNMDGQPVAGWVEVLRCDSCPWEAEGRTWSWLERVASNHTRANSGHRVDLVMDGEA